MDISLDLRGGVADGRRHDARAPEPEAQREDRELGARGDPYALPRSQAKRERAGCDRVHDPVELRQRVGSAFRYTGDRLSDDDGRCIGLPRRCVAQK